MPEHKSRNKVNEAWAEISAILAVPLEFAKKRWKNLKDTYRTKLRQINLTPSGSAGSQKKQWIYFSKMSFLMPYVQVEETKSNYGAENVEHSQDTAGDKENETTDIEFLVPDTKRRREEINDRKHVTNKILKVLDNLEKDVSRSKNETPPVSSIKLFFDSLAAKAENLSEYQQSILEVKCLQIYQDLKFPPEGEAEYLDESCELIGV
ncbi:hypothetical protein Bhyg_12051 [Pseudolycoriella hygida]|uniref:MADF domain-containing protein n=1 Tax=Pseudolycoriella hygida TaxID=35572 RepID=A0A9Q0MWI6_9DIPT|nr:hypothetical protein Bhyg_12051 [Pseudolycoriella hygida]